MSGAGPALFLEQGKKPALRLLLDLYATDGTFRGFTETALIGVVVLFFMHGLPSIPPLGLGAAPAGAARPSMQDIANEDDIARLARRNSSVAPRLNELGLGAGYFAGDPEPLRTKLTEAWRAYSDKNPEKALELLQGMPSDEPHVLLVRGLAIIASPENGALRRGVLDIEKAADNGDAKSMAVLGVLHIIGTPGIQNDLAKGQKLILAAAAKGDVESSRIAGRGFLTGWMGSIDPGRAAKYFRFAADHDDAKAALYLADLYFTGRGVKKDDLEGDRLAEKSAAQEYREAQALVGLRRLHAYAEGITEDASEALRWLERAARQGDPTALRALASYYVDLAAKSGKLDIPRGISLLKQCVERTGDSDCAMSYASFLDTGLAQRDIKETYKMYLLANRSGRNDRAQRRLAELSKDLSTQDVLQIQLELSKHPLEKSQR
jgi:TPR repeat protein